MVPQVPHSLGIHTACLRHRYADNVSKFDSVKNTYDGTEDKVQRNNATFCNALNPKSDTLRFPLLSRSKFSGYNGMPRFKLSSKAPFQTNKAG